LPDGRLLPQNHTDLKGEGLLTPASLVRAVLPSPARGSSKKERRKGC